MRVEIYGCPTGKTVMTLKREHAITFLIFTQRRMGLKTEKDLIKPDFHLRRRHRRKAQAQG